MAGKFAIHIDLEDDKDYDDDDYQMSEAEADTLKQYFTFRFNDFLTEHQRDSLTHAFQNDLTQARKDSLDREFADYNSKKQ